MKKWLKFILVPLGFLIFVGALILLHNQIKNLSYADVIYALQAIPFLKIILALFLALSYYIILGGYDIVAFKYINPKASIKPKDILFTCFVSNVLGVNTGYSMLFGGSVRYRLYSIYNISVMDVTKVLFFSAVTIWLGLLVVGGIVFVASPVSLSGVIKFDISTLWIGIAFLVILSAYIILSFFNYKTIKIFKWKVNFPNIKIVSAQIILATADWVIASLTLYVLMPAGEIPYFMLLKVFLVAQLLGILSQVPGGMGVFEASIAFLLPTAMDNPGVIGGLLAYRAIFYFFPLAIALSMLGFYESSRFVKKFNDHMKIFGQTLSSTVVQILTVSTFLAGMIALFSASTPFDIDQLKTVLNLIPWWLADLSHFLLSAAAVALLFLTRPLQLRVKNAHTWTCVVFGFIIALVLITGVPMFILAGFLILFVVLLLSKRYFYRDIPVLNTRFSTWWFSAIGGVFVLSIWIGFFVNREDIFSWIRLQALFENIMDTSDAARFLRATVGMSFIFIIVLAEQIFRNFVRKPLTFDKNDIKNIVDSSDYAYALDALAADKKYIMNDEKNSFVMYAPSGNSWIALSDPVGEESQISETLWKFKEITDEAYVRPAFIGIDGKYIQVYEDIGLDVFKIGEEAKIFLEEFNSEGKEIENFTEITKNVESQGLKYEIVKPENFEKYKSVFAQINKTWSDKHGYIERNFIPGKYDESYMKDMNFSILVKDDEVCAFSVFSATKNKNEISTGVVRHKDCAKEEFTYMMFKNVLWAKENGYKWFDLGLAFVESEEDNNELVKQFSKMFAFSEQFEHDEKFLREFKNKFSPQWHDKYIAVHPDKYIIMFLKDFAELISPKKETLQLRQFFRRFIKK
ncbi:MAG: phosphatidylglycerol lysyltransferase domain-containing protein [Endomicrobia bacterium]|nr:phosphatidylglycerol lysyltransferase domain-containing protein [Endomicrobiia bacterium]MCL2507111.1 phosphatidylglycerol lysyltransferase domain-containing protein [Endomicrobiia bacterium]